MRITQWGEYGVHFAVFLARQSQAGVPIVGAAEIAESQNVDLQYTQQILQRLRKGDIIESVRGPQGGYRLKRPASEITLLDILVATEGETMELFCDAKPLDGQSCNSDSPCGLRRIWSDLRSHVDSFLRAYTLEALTESGTREGQSPAAELVQIGTLLASRPSGTIG